MDSKELFLKTEPKRLFFMAAIPGAISMLASALYGIFDGMFVGRLLGDTAFAAVNLAFPFVIINFALSDLVAVGSAVPISIALGKKQEGEANNIFSAACALIVITGLFMGLLMYTLSPLVLSLMGAEGELLSLAVQYIRVYALFSPLITMTFAVDNFLRISRKIKMSMWLNVFMSLFTVVLELVFLFFFHLPIWGAALATCISMSVCVISALLPFALGKFQLKFTRPRISRGLLSEIIGCGMPIFLSNIAGRVTSITMNVMLLSMGGQRAVSVYGVLMYVGETLQPLVYGICDSVQPAIGYNWGAKRLDRTRALARYCFIAAAAVSFLSAGLMLLIPEPLVRLFTTGADPEFISLGVFALRIYGTSKLLQWFSFAAQSYMTAVEKMKYATVLSLASAVVFPMIFIFALYPLGLTGLWMNATATMLFCGVLSAVILYKFKKETAVTVPCDAGAADDD